MPFTNNLVLKYNERVMPMRVYQPKKKKRVRKHGYMQRKSTSGGVKVLKRRTLKGRKKLAVSARKK